MPRENLVDGIGLSLSARRAWIEMLNPYEICQGLSVALRKESVDRNLLPLKDVKYKRESLSARRAWIEMTNPKD